MLSYKVALCNDLVTGSMGEKVLWNYLLEAIPELIGIDFRTVGEGGNYAQKARQYIESHYPHLAVIIQNATYIDTVDDNRYTIAFLQDDLRSMGRPSEQQEQNLKKAKKLVTNSQRTAQAYSEYSFEIIPIGVDSQLFQPLPRDEVRRNFGFSSETIGIFVGEFSEVKGWSKIIECIQAYPEIVWILVSKYNQSYHAPNVRVFNRISQEHLSKLLNCADFFIIGSPVETQCLSAVESCLCNVPVIMKNVGIFSDFSPEERAQAGIFGEDFIGAIAAVKGHFFQPRELILKKKLTIEATQNQWRLLLAKVFVEIERGYHAR